MAIDAGFDLSELDEVNRQIIDLVESRYPKSAKALMNKVGNSFRKTLREHYRKDVGKKTGNLLKGVDKSAVYVYDGSYQVRVRNTAPHAHLIEHGHVFYHRGTKTERWVEGKHVAARAQDEYSEIFAKDVDQFVDEILEAGLK